MNPDGSLSVIVEGALFALLYALFEGFLSKWPTSVMFQHVVLRRVS